MMMLLRLHDDVTDVDSCLNDDRDEGDDDDKNQWVWSIQASCFGVYGNSPTGLNPTPLLLFVLFVETLPSLPPPLHVPAF